jgi:oxygen-dependent protoporphyrinogen oxidase
MTHVDASHIYDIVIIGGGISGLSAAYFLERSHPHLSSLLIEARQRLGGWIQTPTFPSGQQYETGPRSLRLRGKSALATSDLILSLGLENEVIKASSDASSRYVILNRAPVALPGGVRDLFCSPIGRNLALKMALEPFQKRGSLDDESVASFFSRRAASPLVEKLANALTSGIWGGEASLLSIYHTFPELKEDETRYGSVLLGRLAAMFHKKESPKIQGMCSLKGGLEQLILAIQSHLKMPVLLETSVQGIHHLPNSIDILTSRGGIRAKKIILAVPELTLRQLVPSLFPSEEAFPHASFVSVIMGWREDCLARRGFGILAPASEDPNVLGIVLDSCVFKEHNLPLKTRMTVILGGTRWPRGIEQEDEELVRIAASRVASWTGVTIPCSEHAVIRSSNAIPQPYIGAKRPATFLLSKCQRIYAICPSFGGSSVNQCITAGHTVATSIP